VDPEVASSINRAKDMTERVLERKNGGSRARLPKSSEQSRKQIEETGRTGIGSLKM
jgi:hypothetical protein